MRKQGFWGANARPFFIQMAMGVAVALVMAKVVMPMGLDDLTRFIVRDGLMPVLRAAGVCSLVTC